MIVSVGAAVVATAVIAVFWAMTFSTGPVQEERTDAPGPLAAIIDSAKSVFSGSGSRAKPAPGENVIQVIDAGKQ